MVRVPPIALALLPSIECAHTSTVAATFIFDGAEIRVQHIYLGFYGNTVSLSSLEYGVNGSESIFGWGLSALMKDSDGSFLNGRYFDQDLLEPIKSNGLTKNGIRLRREGVLD